MSYLGKKRYEFVNLNSVPVILFAKEEDEQNDSDTPIDDLKYEEGFVVPIFCTEPSDEKWCTLNEYN